MLRGEMDEPDRLRHEEQVRSLLQAGVQPCVAARTNSLGMEFVLVRPGTFWMGSPASEPNRYPDEGPRHRVRITRPFYLGRVLVTQEQYEQVTGRRPSSFAPEGSEAAAVAGLDTSRFPVESVSWDDAVAFCAALAARPAESGAGRSYRLPTEAEWEYACRAGAAWSAPFHQGHALSSWEANFDGSQPQGRARIGPNLRRPCTVGSYRPNAFGLYDMHGNVWEWCQDWYDERYYERSPAIDPTGPESGESKVLRGGSFSQLGSSCRAAIRFGRHPRLVSGMDGFRVVLEGGE
jgi:formylglycine-generating enzyme required for sulfatase activity